MPIKRTVLAVLALVAVAAGLPAAGLAGAAEGRSASSTRTLEGVVRILAADTVEAEPEAHDHGNHGDAADEHAFRGRSEDRYRLVLVVGDETFFLRGRDVAPNRRVRVRGTVQGQDVQAESVEDLGAAPAGMTATVTTTVLVMLAHWNVPDTVTPAMAAAQMFQDSSGWYQDASFGQVGQTGDVTPWMRIAGPTGGRCFADHANTMRQAKDAAAALGYDLTRYSNFVLYSPNNKWQTGSDCNNYAGWAYVGAPGTWLNGYMDRRVTVHEQGHNYGLWHAHSHLCSEGASGACTWSDYGDPYDVMGTSAIAGHFSAAAKSALGWMGGRSVDLTAGGSATLVPLAADAVAVSAAVVRVSSSRAYWVEYRRPIDFDGGQPAHATDGLQIRLVDPAVGGDTGANLLDVRPADGASVATATLRPGEQWRSPEGYVFRTTSATATAAALTVSRASSDTTAPRVSSRSPAADATSVRQSTDVTASFSEAVVGVSGTSFTLKRTATGVAVGATVTRNGTTNQWILNPSVDLAADTGYTVTLLGGAGGISDAAGNPLVSTSSTFLTGPAPTAAVAPASGAKNVAVAADVAATFSEAVSGVTASTFTLRATTTGVAVPGVVSRVGTTNQWLLNPSADLAPDTSYTATLTGGPTAIRDLAGNRLGTRTWSFVTGPAPTVASRTPGAGATGVARTAPVTVGFSEAVTGVSGTTFKLKNTATGAAVGGTVGQGSIPSQWRFVPTTALAAGTRYTVTLTGGSTAIRDVAGNPLASVSWTFTTA